MALHAVQSVGYVAFRRRAFRQQKSEAAKAVERELKAFDNLCGDFVERDQRRDKRPFRVAQVIGLTKAVPVGGRGGVQLCTSGAPDRIRRPPMNHNRFIRLNKVVDQL